jgi:uncharacterized protein YjlB
MSFSHFSGPVRAGTVRDGADRNTGVLVLTQSNTVAFSDTTAKNLVKIPAGSQILGISIYVTEEFNATTNNVLTVRNGTTAIAAITATAATIPVGVGTVAVVGAQVGFLNNVGTSDVTLNAIFAGTGTAATTGAATVIVTYAQRAANGSQVPASA